MTPLNHFMFYGSQNRELFLQLKMVFSDLASDLEGASSQVLAAGFLII